MGRKPKKINQHFFDLEQLTEDELKERYYVVGALLSAYRPMGDNGIEIRSSSGDLVQIIRDKLGSEHELISDTRGRNSHFIQIGNAPYLRLKFEELGLTKEKSERRFPENIEEQYLRHLTRGFLDARAKIKDTDKKNSSLEIFFNHLCLAGLDRVLARYAGVQKNEFTGDRIHYPPKDTSRIFKFIYGDWEFTKENGICLPSKKEGFKPYKPTDYSKRPNSIAASKRLEEIKILLASGKRPPEISGSVGFKSRYYIYNAFKNQAGQTITDYRKGLHLSPHQ